jgi:cation transporter-like permease
LISKFQIITLVATNLGRRLIVKKIWDFSQEVFMTLVLLAILVGVPGSLSYGIYRLCDLRLPLPLSIAIAVLAGLVTLYALIVFIGESFSYKVKVVDPDRKVIAEGKGTTVEMRWEAESDQTEISFR